MEVAESKPLVSLDVSRGEDEGETGDINEANLTLDQNQTSSFSRKLDSLNEKIKVF